MLFLSLFLVCVFFFFVSWVGHLYANLALQDSCLVDFLLVLSFLAGLVFDGDVFLSQFFFSSLSLRRWGNTNPLVVRISPSVSSSSRSTSSIRTSRPAPSPRHRARSCFLFSTTLVLVSFSSSWFVYACILIVFKRGGGQQSLPPPPMAIVATKSKFFC